MAATAAWREDMRKRLRSASSKGVKRKAKVTVDRESGKATVQRYDRIGAKFIRIGQQQFTTLKDAQTFIRHLA